MDAGNSELQRESRISITLLARNVFRPFRDLVGDGSFGLRAEKGFSDRLMRGGWF